MWKTVVSVCLCCGLGASAQTDVFDFEDLELGSLDPGLPLALDGEFVDVSLSSGGVLWSITFSGLPSWGDRALLMAGPNTPVAAPLTISLTGGVTGFEFDFGDSGGDADVLGVEYFSGVDGTGDLLGSQTYDWGTQSLDINTIGLISFESSRAIGSVVIEGDGAGGGHTMFYDNLRVTVPAPAVGVVVLGGLGVCSGRRRGG